MRPTAAMLPSESPSIIVPAAIMKSRIRVWIFSSRFRNFATASLPRPTSASDSATM